MTSATEPRPSGVGWPWALANIAGMIAFLLAGSALRVLPGEEGTPGGPGDAFYFLFFVAPFPLVFLVGDLVALIRILFRTPRRARPRALGVWLAVIALWWVAFAVYHRMTFRDVDPRFSVHVRSHPSEDPPGAASPQDGRIRVLCHDIGSA